VADGEAISNDSGGHMFWTTIPVEQQPTLTLHRWRVMRLSDESLHLVGYCVENREGRVSSTVNALDAERLCARTGTGRLYLLDGPPANDPDASYVWDNWRRINGVTEWEDITAAVWHQSRKQNGCGASAPQGCDARRPDPLNGAQS
jgi:hypothetical protein